jgi:hypothetical protein
MILQGVNVGKAASWSIPNDVDDKGQTTYRKWITMDRPPVQNGQQIY